MRASFWTAALAVVAVCLGDAPSGAGATTWDGKYKIDQIEVTVVYFVPSDREPLIDWKDRVDYFCERIERFHAREFEGHSKLTTQVHPQPFISNRNTPALRKGDANSIYFQTLREVDERLDFGRGSDETFPILLVLSDINWRALDDFYRLNTEGPEPVFEGNLNQGQHFPGAASGGARAAYLADRGVGWGLVSGDGWRVPYRGSDCVVYHEGCGHTVGLPHPEPGNGSVMSLGQYQGWISESWLDKDQKSRLGWAPSAEDAAPPDPELELFTHFRALPQPVAPLVGNEVRLRFDWPDEAAVQSLRVRFQTAISGPWIDVDIDASEEPPESISLGEFDRATPVSYRVDVELQNGATSELWGYFQVRSEPGKNPLPRRYTVDLEPRAAASSTGEVVREFPQDQVDLLAMADPASSFTVGEWTQSDGRLESPKAFGARIELPYSPPTEYELTLVVEPLDEPHGLILGHVSGNHRFATLFQFRSASAGQSAIENIDGKNVGNESTFSGNVFRQNQLSLVTVRVLRSGVQMSVDGRLIADWKGEPSQLSLSDYWSTPQPNALMLGAYDCRYRFHRVTLVPLSGEGKILEPTQ